MLSVTSSLTFNSGLKNYSGSHDQCFVLSFRSDFMISDDVSDLAVDQEVTVEPRHVFGARREAGNKPPSLDERTVVFPQWKPTVDRVCSR